MTNSHSRYLAYEHIKHAGILDIDDIHEKFKRINWKKMYGSTGKVLRSGAWFTASECKCPYTFGGHAFPAQPFEPWMVEVSDVLQRLFGIGYRLDSVNLSLYEDYSQSVGMHEDNEQLFKSSVDGSSFIVSMSFGETRAFGIKGKYDQVKDAKHIDLNHGDILSMEDQMQLHYQHSIDPVDSSGRLKGNPRINATWRVLHSHCKKCPLAS